jgi:hypothetical protein
MQSVPYSITLRRPNYRNHHHHHHNNNSINYTTVVATDSPSAGVHNPRAIQHPDGRVFVFSDGVSERPNANYSR